MHDLGNLGGTLMCGDIQLFSFKFRDGYLQNVKIHDLLKCAPFQFSENIPKCVNQESVTDFFIDRLTPQTRIGILEDLKESGIPYYHPEAMVRYSNGRCVDDDFWLDCDDEKVEF